MTRQDYIEICSLCTNRSFNPKTGIICGLTNEIADFNGNCADYNEDKSSVKQKVLRENHDKQQSKTVVNKGRIALFVIAGLYVLVGIWEAFMIPGADLLFGIVDWSIAAVFVGLGIWSFKKASLALIIGLAFYALIIVLLFAVDPLTLFQGILWKVIIIVWLVYGISEARKEEAKQKMVSDDLLDQL